MFQRVAHAYTTNRTFSAHSDLVKNLKSKTKLQPYCIVYIVSANVFSHYITCMRIGL